MTDFRTPLSRARGSGAAGHGASHWVAERVSSIALAPLTPGTAQAPREWYYYPHGLPPGAPRPQAQAAPPQSAAAGPPPPPPAAAPPHPPPPPPLRPPPPPHAPPRAHPPPTGRACRPAVI